MSWAPAAGLLKRDCCVVAPDLRGHGMTSSSSSSSSSSDASTGGASGDLMSLESLAEDVVSLLVEIFTSGVLLQPASAEREQVEAREKSLPKDSSSSGGGGGGDFVGNSTAVATTVDDAGAPQCAGGFDKGDERGGSAPPWLEEEAVGTEKEPAGAARHRRDGDDVERGRTRGAEETPTPTPTPTNPGIPLAAASGMSSVVVSGSTGDALEAGFEAPKAAACVSTATTPTTTTMATTSDASFGCTRVLLVGHSLGGSIAVRVARAAEDFKRRCNGTGEILGVVAVDVVEGTALAALDDMPEVGGRTGLGGRREGVKGSKRVFAFPHCTFMAWPSRKLAIRALRREQAMLPTCAM